MHKQSVLLCVYLIIACFTAIAQGPIGPGSKKEYAAFKNETRHLKNDTNKVLRYLAYAKMLEGFSPDTVLAIAHTALNLSQKLHYTRGIELSIFEEGIHAESRNDYPLATQYYREAAKIAGAHNLYQDLYPIYNSSLNAYYYLADYPSAMEIAQKGLSLAERMNDKENQAHFDNQAGFIYQKQEKPGECIKYYRIYLQLANELNNRVMVADACTGLGDGYLLAKQYQRSLQYLFKALDIYNSMGEMVTLDHSRRVYKPDKVGNTLYKISTVFKQAGNYRQALQYTLQVLALHDKIGGGFNQYDLADYYINTGDIYRSLKDYKQAGVFLNKGLAIARSIRHREDIRDAYDGLSKNFASRHRYDSAYYYRLLFTGLKDSIINEKVSREINKLEADRADKEIILLNQRQKLKETSAARQNLVRNVIIGFTTLVALALILVLYLQTGIKQQKLLFEKHVAVQTERQRISSDMHDDIGTGLSTMLIYVNILKLKLAGSGDATHIDRIAALGTGLVDQMKEIVWSLNPGNDRLDNLLFYIREYFVSLFEPLAYTTHIIYPAAIPEMELANEIRRNIFLCVKESLNNIIKHAGATRVELKAQIVHHTLVIQVKDNGRGLPAAFSNATGNGLKNIRQRMHAIKGKFHISNHHGVAVKLEIHLKNYPNG